MTTSTNTPPRHDDSQPRQGWRAIPTGVWALGFVSMFMDISSEMIHALLPLYMVSVLGISALGVGIIEGIAEATASIVKVFSGALSDRLGKRRLLAVIGYGLGALTKPVFPLAGTLDWLMGARFVDRVGKGIRGAPRDALVADVTPPELRGAAYGLRQTLDTIGAFMGPLLAIGLMWWTASHYQMVFWLAVIPAFLAVAILVVFVREPEKKVARPARMPLRRDELARLSARYWWIVALGSVFTLARFSEAFLILRADEAGLTAVWVPAVLVVMGVAYALSAYPAGALSDRMSAAPGRSQASSHRSPQGEGTPVHRMGVLGIGLVLLVVADLVLAFLPGVPGLVVGVAFWGLHMGFTQGVFGALVADHAPPELRGTAFGMFHLVTGVATLLASVIAGALWHVFGYQVTFVVGAAFALATIAGLAASRRMGM